MNSSLFPSQQLTGNGVSIQIALPDSQQGYYRGTRFDWSGVFRSLHYGGHSYIDEWFSKHDPQRHDGICGPVDEFTQIGYEQTLPGEGFLKIGVGVLRRPQAPKDEPYDRFKLYEVIDPGVREITQQHNSISFRHRISFQQYGYDYLKTLHLTDEPGFSLSYKLQNIGDATLSGHVYNHNFFTLDHMVVGSQTQISFPFTPQGTWRETYDSVSLGHSGILFQRNLRVGESVFMGDLQGFSPTAGTFKFQLLNKISTAGVQVASDQTPSYIVFWACPTVACIEPYLPFYIPAGETKEWELRYRLLY